MLKRDHVKNWPSSSAGWRTDVEPTAQYKQCPQCKQPTPIQAPTCAQCGRPFRTQVAPHSNDQTQFFTQPPVAPGHVPAQPPVYPQQPYPHQPYPHQPYPHQHQPYQGPPPAGYPPPYPPPYAPAPRADIIQKHPGAHSTTPSILLAVLIGGWAAALYNQQYMKGVVLLCVSLVLIPATAFMAAIPLWIAGMIDGILIGNRLNRGEAVGQWQFF